MTPPEYIDTPASINGKRVRPGIAIFYSCLADSYPRYGSIELIISRLWGYMDQPETYRKIVHIYANGAREALAGTGWKIENVYGQGYVLTPPIID